MTRTQPVAPAVSRPELLARLKRLIRELDETIAAIEADTATRPPRAPGSQRVH